MDIDIRYCCRTLVLFSSTTYPWASLLKLGKQIAIEWGSLIDRSGCTHLFVPLSFKNASLNPHGRCKNHGVSNIWKLCTQSSSSKWSLVI